MSARGVLIGNNVKLQNYALVYEPARLEDNVFIGPRRSSPTISTPGRWT
jgi:hypothetical protein